MDPRRFREYIVPSLARQCSRLDRAIYHLDGPDAIRHIDALMEIDRLKGIQWTSGDGQVDGVNSKWFAPLHDKVLKQGKCMLLYAIDGGVDQWIANSDAVVNRYGTAGVYIQYPVMSQNDADKLMTCADKHWK